jgi:Glycosyl hydrolase family 10
MIDHINTGMGRYQGRVRAWDVVNEAFNEDGSLRQSPFFTQLGSNPRALSPAHPGAEALHRGRRRPCRVGRTALPWRSRSLPRE